MADMCQTERSWFIAARFGISHGLDDIRVLSSFFPNRCRRSLWSFCTVKVTSGVSTAVYCGSGSSKPMAMSALADTVTTLSSTEATRATGMKWCSWSTESCLVSLIRSPWT